MTTDRTHIRYSVETLRNAKRPPEFFAEVMELAAMKSPDGKFVWLSRAEAQRLSEKYREYWQPEVALQRQEHPGPLWWRAYTGARLMQDVGSDLDNLFKFREPAKTALISELRDVALALMDEQTNCTPCQMTTIVNKVAMDYIFRLNAYESIHQ